jgi:hypothetical protein
MAVFFVFHRNVHRLCIPSMFNRFDDISNFATVVDGGMSVSAIGGLDGNDVTHRFLDPDFAFFTVYYR